MGELKALGIKPPNQHQSMTKDLRLLAVLHSLVGIFASGISGLFGYKSILTIIQQVTQTLPGPSTTDNSLPEVRVVGRFLDLLGPVGTSLTSLLLLVYFLILAAGILGLYRFMADIFGSQGQKARLFLVLGLVGYFFGSLIQGFALGTFSLNLFRPGVRPILMAFCSLWVGYLALQILEVLTSRELFIKTFGQIPQGDLLQRLQEEHPWILRLQDQIRWLNGFALSQIVSPLLVLLLLAVLNPLLIQGWSWPLLSLGMVFHGMILLGLGNTYLDDHRSLEHTVLMALEQRTLRLMVGGLLLGLALALGTILPGRTSLIPTPWITRFLAWLASIFTPRTQWELEQEILDRFIPPSPPPPTLDPDYALEAFELAKLVQQILEILRRSLVIGAGVGILFFLLYPLLNTKAFHRWLEELKAGTSRTFLGRLLGMVIGLAKFIQASWNRLFPPISGGKGGVTREQVEGIEISSYLGKLIQERASRRKPSNKLLKVLEEYLQWGIDRGGRLTKSTTLHEFSRSIPGLSEQGRIEERRVLVVLEHLLYDGSVTLNQESTLIREAQANIKELIAKSADYS